MPYLKVPSNSSIIIVNEDCIQYICPNRVNDQKTDIQLKSGEVLTCDENIADIWKVLKLSR